MNISPITPDWEGLLRNLRRQGTPDRVYYFEHGIDAKHSFENNVLPVTEAKRRYGTRLSLLGGMDVDLLARVDQATIRAKTHEILKVCQPSGGYCLGSGNWVTDYVPLENYLAMLDEARRFC